MADAKFGVLLYTQQLRGTLSLPSASEKSSHATPHADSTSEKPTAQSSTRDLLALGNSSRVTLPFSSH